MSVLLAVSLQVAVDWLCSLAKGYSSCQAMLLLCVCSDNFCLPWFLFFPPSSSAGPIELVSS